MGSFTRHPFQPKNICSLPNMNVKLLGTLASAKRNCNSEVLTFSTNVVGPAKQSVTLRFPDIIVSDMIYRTRSYH